MRLQEERYQEPATLITQPVAMLPNGRLALEENITFAVNVDGYTGSIELDIGDATLGGEYPDPAKVATYLQSQFDDSNNGLDFLGVTVALGDEVAQTFSFSTGSTGGEAFIEVVPASLSETMGLKGVTSAFGSTSTWVD